MRTSLEWWNETKADSDKLNNWLQRQCFGEFQAYKRISIIAKKFSSAILSDIAAQEFTHYTWIRKYLKDNGINIIAEHDERYWSEINLKFDHLYQAAAVGHLAEMMRLERIKVIAVDQDFPELAAIFTKILKDEEYHVEAFRLLTTEEELEIAAIDHEAGMQMLGLVV